MSNGVTLRELITKFGFDVDEKPLKALDSSVESMKSSLIKLTALATAAAGTLVATAKATAAYGDEVAKTSRQIGIQSDALQELRHAAQLGGASTADLDNGVRKFSRVLIEGRNGMESYKEALMAAGLTQDEINNKNLNTEDLMGRIADKFQEMPDGAEKTAIAMELFGRAGTKLIPMLSGGSKALAEQREEARKLGVVMSKDNLKASEDFTDELLRFEQVLTGIRNAIGAKLLPMFIKLGKRFQALFLANKKMIVSKIDSFFKMLVEFIENFVAVLTTAYRVVTSVVNLFGGWEKVIRTVLFAMTALFGAQMLIALGNMATGIFTLIKAMKTFRMATLAANAAALIVPLLIGAAIAAVALAIEDIVAFFQGKKSVTGVIVEKFKGMFSWLVEQWEMFAGYVEGIFDRIVGKIVSVFEKVKSMVSAFKGLLGGKITAAFEGAKDFASSLNPFADNTASPSAVTTSKNNIVNVDSPISVSVPPGTPPEEVAQKTKEGVAEALTSLFNDTKRQVQSPIAE